MNETMAALVALNNKRRFLLRYRTMLVNQSKAFLRSCLGFTVYQGETDRTKLKKAAVEALKRIRKGDCPEGLELAYSAIRSVYGNEKAIASMAFSVPRISAETAEQLPGAAFVAETRGVGLLTLAQLHAETRGIHDYPHKYALYRRLCVGFKGDERQRKVKNAELAQKLGYNPERRSVVWVAGDCLIKQSEHYRALMQARKEVELLKPEVAEAKKGRKLWAHRRAKRWMEKQFLLDLWVACRRDAGHVVARPVAAAEAA